MGVASGLGGGFVLGNRMANVDFGNGLSEKGSPLLEEHVREQQED